METYNLETGEKTRTKGGGGRAKLVLICTAVVVIGMQ